MSQKTCTSILAIAAFAGMISSAHAANANPLHPAYFADRAKAVNVISGDRELYVNAHNPLHPMFGRASDWQIAAGGTGSVYRDSRNPLHPSFGWF